MPAAVFAVVVGLVAPGPTPASAQAGSPEAEVMRTAAEWVLERVPADDVCIDPHRSGSGADHAAVRTVADALGARLATLEETRRCRDTMDPSTCTLGADAILAIDQPAIDDGSARIRVYIWSRDDDPRHPVRKETFAVSLSRVAGAWRVTSGR